MNERDELESKLLKVAADLGLPVEDLTQHQNALLLHLLITNNEVAMGIGELIKVLERIEEDRPTRQQFKDELRKHDHRSRILTMVIGGVIAVLLAMSLAVNGAFLVNSFRNRQTLKSVQRTNDLIVECTTPSGTTGTPKGSHACFEDGRVRQAAALQQIFTVEIAIADCARQQGVDVKACVAQKTNGG